MMTDDQPISYQLTDRTECRYCTMPVEGPGDVCAFCATYAPPPRRSAEPPRPEFVAQLLDDAQAAVYRAHWFVRSMPYVGVTASQHTSAAVAALADAIEAVSK